MANISELEAAGFDVTAANEQQRAVLDGLSTEELEVLKSVKERVTAAADVEGHENVGGGWLW